MLKKIVNNSTTVRDTDLDPSASEYNVRVAALNGIGAGPVRARSGRIPGPGPGPMFKHRHFRNFKKFDICLEIWCYIVNSLRGIRNNWSRDPCMSPYPHFGYGYGVIAAETPFFGFAICRNDPRASRKARLSSFVLLGNMIIEVGVPIC